MPYLGHMTSLGDTSAKGRVLEFGVRDRLRLAREDAYPTMDKVEFSTRILGVGKNMVTAYESKTHTGTREENMKDMVLRRWAEVCEVNFEWLKYGVGAVHTGPETPTTDYGFKGSVIELPTRALSAA